GGLQSLAMTGHAVLRESRLRFYACVAWVFCNSSRRRSAGSGRVLRETLGMGHEQAPAQSRERDAGDETPSRHDAHDSAEFGGREEPGSTGGLDPPQLYRDSIGIPETQHIST